MMPDGRLALNDYQQLMVKMSVLAPYNAVHAVSMKNANVNLALLQDSIHHVINALGIGHPQLSADHQYVTFTPIQQRLPLVERIMALHQHVESEMNHRFAPNDTPLRFFMIYDNETLYLAVTYNHWIADAFAIGRFIESIFAHIHGEIRPELTLSTPQMNECFKPIYGKRAGYHRYLTVIQSALRFSRAFRTPISHVEQTESGNCSYVFEPAILKQLSQYCKTEQITLNDLFLTVLARLFGEITQKNRAMIQRKGLKPRRDRIVIAVISNIRRQSRFPLSNIFSLFLGFFYLSFRSPEQQSFHALSHKICSQTKRLKHNNMAVKQSLLFRVQNFIWDRKNNTLSQYRLFSKNTPITVGISNMDMRHTESALHNSINQYIRFSPTAMVCPIVFNLTTFNDHLSLGINFREACYTLAEATDIRDKFVREIHRLVVKESVGFAVI